MINPHFLEVAKKEILRPKAEKVLASAGIAITIGLLITLGLGLFIRDELSRSLPAVVVMCVLFTWTYRQLNWKNKRRWQDLKETIQPDGEFETEQITTNPAKPKKCVKIKNTKTDKAAIIPLKRWKKIVEKTSF